MIELRTSFNGRHCFTEVAEDDVMVAKFQEGKEDELKWWCSVEYGDEVTAKIVEAL